MKTLRVGLYSMVLLALFAQSAQAQCDFDVPPKAKGMKLSLTRSFASCPSITFAAPNSSTGGGFPACAPPYAHSPYVFDNKSGSCSLKTSHKIEEPCSNGDPYACANLKISANCSGILEADGVTPTNDIGWSLTMVLRVTMNDPDQGDMTMVDFPLSMAFPPASKGSLKLSTDSTSVFEDLGLPGLPGCVGVQLISASIQDPSGQPFATPGSASIFP